jgi:hypothetical protein
MNKKMFPTDTMAMLQWHAILPARKYYPEGFNTMILVVSAICMIEQYVHLKDYLGDFTDALDNWNLFLVAIRSKYIAGVRDHLTLILLSVRLRSNDMCYSRALSMNEKFTCISIMAA